MGVVALVGVEGRCGYASQFAKGDGDRAGLPVYGSHLVGWGLEFLPVGKGRIRFRLQDKGLRHVVSDADVAELRLAELEHLCLASNHVGVSDGDLRDDGAWEEAVAVDDRDVPAFLADVVSRGRAQIELVDLVVEDPGEVVLVHELEVVGGAQWIRARGRLVGLGDVEVPSVEVDEGLALLHASRSACERAVSARGLPS